MRNSDLSKVNTWKLQVNSLGLKSKKSRNAIFISLLLYSLSCWESYGRTAARQILSIPALGTRLLYIPQGGGTGFHFSTPWLLGMIWRKWEGRVRAADLCSPHRCVSAQRRWFCDLEKTFAGSYNGNNISKHKIKTMDSDNESLAPELGLMRLMWFCCNLNSLCRRVDLVQEKKGG